MSSQQEYSAPVTIPEESTIDESVCMTIWRDVRAIGRNLRSVLIPINWQFSNRDQALRNWDLWGPLVRQPLSRQRQGERPALCAAAQG